ncbi:uncharacterized protein LOC134193153 isoform X3 [Corticium candelabrum]|uniref:uncharacterized protein LOC134193153 isoform X3 n=1 Tax=Corticium candelabrum TaxID=121492 RepID=UPI002E2686CB|nr:uncharacterized protein LOC134193153 isoform X3 [Corticium candelabrum]
MMNADTDCAVKNTCSDFTSSVIADGTDRSGICFADNLFTSCLDLAIRALDTDFIQGIKTGTLDPTVYKDYATQDAVYVYSGASLLSSLITVCKHENLEDLEMFASAELELWSDVATNMLTQWHITDPSNVVLNSAAAGYKNFMEKAFLTLPPYNAIIALLPCNRLWNWLGEQLLPYNKKVNVSMYCMDNNCSCASTTPLQGLSCILLYWIMVKPLKYFVKEWSMK